MARSRPSASVDVKSTFLPDVSFPIVSGGNPEGGLVQCLPIDHCTVTQRAWPAEVLAVERPVCTVCLRPIKPTDVVSGPRNALMHQWCDHARARGNPGSRAGAKLVLVVDDDDDQRAMYAMVLEAAGYCVVESAHGTNAIAKAIGLRPDLILLDLSMPGLDGCQTCRWLKATPETSDIPVIMLTGHAVEQAEREALDAGCDRFLIKGSHPEPVIQAIREILAA